MKAVILAGGLGTRLSEETTVRPKPMVEIGGRPILWHILKLYSQQGINDFIICLGYKGYIIKEYFANYFLHTSDVTFDIARNNMTVHDSVAEPWRITLVDTGDDSGTGGRLRRVANYLKGEDTFLMTYGDGVSDVDIQAYRRRPYGTVDYVLVVGRRLATADTLASPGWASLRAELDREYRRVAASTSGLVEVWERRDPRLQRDGDARRDMAGRSACAA